MLEIRPEQPQDSTAIRALVESAFQGTCEARLVELLRAAGKAIISLVASQDGKVVGHILFSPVEIEKRPTTLDALGLAPVAVSPQFQRQGIGSRLIEEGLRLCRDGGYDLVVVLGDPRYYSRFGFKRAKDYGLDNEYGAHDEFMALELGRGALSRVGGLVKYQPEFALADQ